MGRRHGSKQSAKRKAARIWMHYENAIGHLADLYNLFLPDHPELAEVIEAIAAQTTIVQSEWEDFWRMSWGELPEDMASWT